MMFVGYADCESDSVRMWNLVTAQVMTTLDIIWFKKLFFLIDSLDLIEFDTLTDLEDDVPNDETPTKANNQPESWEAL